MDAAVTCALPYHATVQFVRLVQVLRVEGTCWTFLSAVKSEGAPPTRDALVACVARNSSLLALVADAATTTATGSARGSRGVANSFYTLLLTEAVASMKRLPEECLPWLLQYVNGGLEKSASLDHHAGALILVAQLASRAQLARALVDALLVSIAKAVRSPVETHSLQAALQLMRTQAVKALPQHAITYFVKTAALPEMLRELSLGSSADALLLPLLAGMMERLAVHHTYRDTLVAILQSVPVDSLAETLAATLLDAVAQACVAANSEARPDDDTSSSVTAMRDVLRALHRRCPKVVERSAERSLLLHKARGSYEPFASFLRDAFGGTGAQPLRDHSGVMLASGLEHDDPVVREAALHELLLHVRTGSGVADVNEEESTSMLLRPGYLRDVLLRRVCDSDPRVVSAVLALEPLADLVADDAALFAAAASSLHAVARTLRGSASQGGKGGGLRGSAKRLLKLLAVLLPKRAPLLADSATRLLLNYVVSCPELQPVAQAARKYAATSQHPLFKLWCSVAHETDEAAATDTQILGSIGGALRMLSGEQVALVRVSWPDLQADGRAVVLLALHCALHEAPDAAVAGKLAQLGLDLIQAGGDTLYASCDIDDAASWDGAMPTRRVFDAWAPGEPSFMAMLQRKVLLDVVLRIPAEAADPTRQFGFGPLGELFKLCAAAPPSCAFDAHVDALLLRSQTVFKSANQMLRLFASEAPAAVPEACQVKALALLRLDEGSAEVPHVLVAFANSRLLVRRAAMECILRLGAAGGGTGSQAARGAKRAASRAPDTETTEMLAALAAWARTNEDALIANGDTMLAQLLRAALATPTFSALKRTLLEFLRSGLVSHASLLVLSALCGAGEEPNTAASIAPLWKSLCLQATSTELGTQLCHAACKVFVAAAAADRPKSGASPNVADAVFSSLQDTVPCSVRTAVFELVAVDLYAALAVADKQRLLTCIVRAASADTDGACREAARGAISRLPVDGPEFAQLLLAACSSMRVSSDAVPPGKKRTPAVEHTVQRADEPLKDLTAVFELLSWREVNTAATLVHPTQQAISLLLDVAGADAEPAESDNTEAVTRPALEYRVQLGLSVLTTLVRSCGPECAVDATVIVRALRETTDAGVNRAALELLAAAAAVAPEKMVDDLISISVALTSAAATRGLDRGGARALQDAFSGVAACWTAARKDDGIELMKRLVLAMPEVSEHQRLPLLAALLRSLPSPTALSHACELLLTPSATGAGAPVAAANQLQEVASALCSSRPPRECLLALCAWLRRVRDSAGALDAVKFTAAQLRAPGRAAWFSTQIGDSEVEHSLSQLLAESIVLLRRFADKQELSGDAVPAKHAVQSLLAAVEALMSPLPFLKAVAQLFDSEDVHVQRRALRLFLARLRASSSASLAASAQHAALIEPLAALVRRTEKAAVSSRCAGLTVLGALMERFGQSHEFAAKLLPVLPDVLHAARHRKTQVAAAGMECIASAVNALSTRLIPLLPTVMPVLLDVLQSDDADPARLCAALGAVKAVAERMDSFLSPFVHQLVQLLLSPRFVSNAAAEVLQAAAAARVSVAQRMPARILLEPLTSSWETSLDAGLDCASALLDQVKVTVEAMDADAVALHHDTVFGACVCFVRLLHSLRVSVFVRTDTCLEIAVFLLRCLDVRRLQSSFVAVEDSATTPEGVESAAVAAAVALVLKLSEARFTPLFMTALEWSRARAEGCARPLAFFRLVSALAAALRSVFVPFFRHLLTDCIAFLEEQPADGARPKKKSRAVASQDALARVAFQLRIEVVRSLGSCFMHDAVGFLDETRFNSLLRPLVLQLTLEVPAEASPEEVADMDAVLVDCIFQMAQNVRQDTLWRPLNRSVLLATRSEQVRPRRLGLAVVARLVESLAEEYLVLLPETLPFLAELMEDADEEVEAAARQLVTNLSALAEEDVAELLAS